LQPASPLFSRHLVQQGTRLLIDSECSRCGASMLVSSHDGSLEKWEQDHQRECSVKQPKKAEPGQNPKAG
jgi:hypothetical protein